MDIKQHNINLDIIEGLIDKNSVHYVLDTIAQVMSAKADHIRENYQDEYLAKCWDSSCAKVLELAHKFNNK